jgi:hypothetical protein
MGIAIAYDGHWGDTMVTECVLEPTVYFSAGVRW